MELSDIRIHKTANSEGDSKLVSLHQPRSLTENTI